MPNDPHRPNPTASSDRTVSTPGHALRRASHAGGRNSGRFKATQHSRPRPHHSPARSHGPAIRPR